MVGITLSPEQIRQAPPEVRRWREVVAAHDLVRTDAAPAFGTAPRAPEAFQSPYSISVPTVGAPQAGGGATG
jgi:hypothetical protein